MNKNIWIALGGFAFLVVLAIGMFGNIPERFSAATVARVPQGGTGWGNIVADTLLTGNGTGNLATTSIGSGLQLSGGVLSATGGGVGSGLATTSPVSAGNLLVYSASGAGSAFGVATGTISVPTGLTVTANRSAIGGATAIALDTGYVIPLQTTLDAKALGATTITIAGTANQVTSSAGAQDISTNRTWTLSLPSHVILTSLFSSIASTTNATTTNLHITSLSTGGAAINGNGKVYSAATTTAGTGLTYSGNAFNVNTTQNITALSGLTTNALVLTGSSNGTLGSYTGASCTNQVIEDLSVLGAPTCVSINNGYWSGTDLSVANGGTGLSTFGNTNTPLFTSAADTLTHDTDWTYNGTTNLMTVVNASTTKLSAIATGAAGSATSTVIKPGLDVLGFGGFGGSATTTIRGDTATSTFSSFISATGATLSSYFEAAAGYFSTILKIPVSATLSFATAGFMGVDTTSEQLRWYGGATNATQVALRTYEPTLIVSSTTPSTQDFADYRTGTSTFNVGGKLRAMTLSRVYCKSTNNTALVMVGSFSATSTDAGSNKEVFCTPGGTSFTPTSNNTFASRANIFVAVGSATTTDPNSVTITLSYTETAD